MKAEIRKIVLHEMKALSSGAKTGYGSSLTERLQNPFTKKLSSLKRARKRRIHLTVNIVTATIKLKHPSE